MTKYYLHVHWRGQCLWLDWPDVNSADDYTLTVDALCATAHDVKEILHAATIIPLSFERAECIPIEANSAQLLPAHMREIINA